MVSYDRLSLLYWDLSDLPSENTFDILKAVDHLVRALPFKQVIITADKTVIPNIIKQIAEMPLNADIYISGGIDITKSYNNTIHKDTFIDTYTLVANIWSMEQLITIGADVKHADMMVGEFERSDFDYEDLKLYPKTWFTYHTE